MQKLVAKVKQLVAELEGKKTYIASLLSALAGVVTLVHGGHLYQAAQLIATGAIGSALRAAIKKV